MKIESQEVLNSEIEKTVENISSDTLISNDNECDVSRSTGDIEISSVVLAEEAAVNNSCISESAVDTAPACRDTTNVINNKEILYRIHLN